MTAQLDHATDVEAFFARLDERIKQTDAIDNAFYRRFRSGGLSKEQLQLFADNYYLYIRTFPQILAGLSHRVDDESIRVELAKTIVSELGDGEAGKAHFLLFERAIGALGVTPHQIDEVDHLPEATALVEGIRQMFLRDDPAVALGAHYTIEFTGLPMITSLYEGFRTYPGSTTESMEYFYLHLLVESEHVEWITAGVRPNLGVPEREQAVEHGALHMAELLGNFWGGLDRAIAKAA
jgi:pyrroloquinoline-quinone synthase